MGEDRIVFSEVSRMAGSDMGIPMGSSGDFSFHFRDSSFQFTQGLL